jgi:hypothetical protein
MKKDNYIHVDTNSILPSYAFKIKGIEYFISFDKSGELLFIGTISKKIKLPENIKVGDSIIKCIKMTNKKIYNKRGWGYYLILDSGWNIMLSGNKKDSKAVMVFKSVYAGETDILGDVKVVDIGEIDERVK